MGFDRPRPGWPHHDHALPPTAPGRSGLPRIDGPRMRVTNGDITTGMGMHRGDLADFLRRSRERLTPRYVGLVEGPRRRTPGLRREEVAVLAGMSADYYMRLEQARS